MKPSKKSVIPRLECRELAANFVAEICQFDAHLPLPATSIAEIKSSWAQFPVLVFPKIHLDAAQLTRFAKQLGDFGTDPYLGSVEEHPHVVEVRRGAAESAPIFGASWHSDWSFQVAPPSATLLHAKVVPPVGGDTVFADCCAAYDALPEALKVEIEGLNAKHTAAPSYGPRGLFAKDDDSRSMDIIVSEAAERSQLHPVVRTHPISGRKGLFVNHVYTVGVDGMSARESKVLLNELFTHMTKESLRYRHTWRPDMLVVWDNRRVVHYADGGYEGYERIMHRVTLAGERPR